VSIEPVQFDLRTSGLLLNGKPGTSPVHHQEIPARGQGLAIAVRR